MLDTLKRCGRCRLQLPLDQFNSDSSRDDGKCPKCKPCSRILYAESMERKAAGTRGKCGRTNDLTGQRFGMLTVQRRIGSKLYTHGKIGLWEVVCDCGVVRELITNAIRAQESCGCLRKIRGFERRHADKETRLVGQQFGRWMVLSFDSWGDAEKRDNPKWWCKCSCPLAIARAVLERALICGDSQSCGCWQKERTAASSSELKYIHGHTGRHKKDVIIEPPTPTYRAWGQTGVKGRDPSWDDFLTFLADMGEKPNDELVLARLDSTEPFSKANCVWGNIVKGGVIEYKSGRLLSRRTQQSEGTRTAKYYGRHG